MPEQLRAAAQQSIGTLGDDVAQALIKYLAVELQHSLAKEKRLRQLQTDLRPLQHFSHVSVG